MQKYYNPRLHNAVVAGTGMEHPRRPHVVLGSELNGYVQGDLVDANGICDLIHEKNVDTFAKLEALEASLKNESKARAEDIDNLSEQIDRTIAEKLSSTETVYGESVQRAAEDERLQSQINDLNAAIQEHQDISGKADKTAVDAALATKADKSTTYTKEEVDNLIDGVDVSEQLEDYYTEDETDAALASKQDTIDDLSTIRSGAAAGATAVQPAALTPIENDIAAIEGKIPSAASTSNQLADKAFVNSTLADKADTADIPTALSQLSQDSTHRTVTDSEKSTWDGKQDTLTFDNTPTANSNNPVTSGGVIAALDLKADQSTTYTKTEVDNKLADGVYVGSTVGTDIKQLKDKNNVVFYPQTHTEAVVDDYGNSVSSVLSTFANNYYDKEEVNNLIVPANSTIEVVSTLPSSGETNTIYRVAGTNSYTDYGWDGTQFVPLATFDISNIDATLTQSGVPADAKAVGDNIRDEDIIWTRAAFSNWKKDIAISLTAGTEYYLYTEPNTTHSNMYLYFYDAEDTKYTLKNYTNSTARFKFTPSVDYVKMDIYYRNASKPTITTKNTLRTVSLISDISSDLHAGGTDKPLSAEAGKELGEAVGVLNTMSIPLNQGTINNKGYMTPSYTHAKASFANSGFDIMRIKEGYQYILYSSNTTGIYNNTTFTTVVGTYTSEPYINKSSAAYFWIDVKKESGGQIDIAELCDIITVTYGESRYNFKTVNDVAEYYKYGTECVINVGMIAGEGLNDNGGVTSNSSYKRTEYFNVEDIDAIKWYVATTYDDTRYSNGCVVRWTDAEGNAIGCSKYNSKRKENIVIITVPANAVKASLYIVSGGTGSLIVYKHNNATDAHYYNSGRNKVAKLARVSLIIVSGQSLGNGSGSAPISKSNKWFPLREIEGSSFFPLVNKASTSEKPDRGMGEMIVEATAMENNISCYCNEWERHYLVFANVAHGSNTIADLTNRFSEIDSVITKCKAMCDEFGYTMEAPIWVWMQGEQDMKAKMSAADYKTALLNYQELMCQSLVDNAGITKRPKCVIYQPACQCLFTQNYSYGNEYMDMMNAYVELIRDNDEFVASTPAYIFDGSNPELNNEGFIHLNSLSYKMLGAYNGYAIKKYIIDDVLFKGVIPKTVSVSDNTITIKYNVPCPPLKFDTEWVKETPLVNTNVHTYGFNVVKSDNTELITNVSVFWDTVTITCSESPVGAKLRYGLNGTRIHMTNSEYWGIDGRIYGGRGNLRDSQGMYVYKNIDEYGMKIPMHNWAYCFEKVLE